MLLITRRIWCLIFSIVAVFIFVSTNPVIMAKRVHQKDKADIPSGNVHTLAKEAAKPGYKKHTADMGWWKKDRFGMFIHWGLYSLAAGYWNGKRIMGGDSANIMADAHLTRSQYAVLASKFDPVDFNADRWVRMAKSAGVKYIVITSKHHDGFCMFRTKATHYNAVDDTPWHKDPLAMLAAACKKYGIRFCVYYAVDDWHSPYTLPNRLINGKPQWILTRFTPNGGGEKYVHYMETQVGELIKQYHPGLIWFDDSYWYCSWVTSTGQHVPGWTRSYASQVFNYVRKLDPKVIINNRMQYGFGDYSTPEQTIPSRGLPGPWESCMTINNNWGYNRADHHWKSVRTLIANLIRCASGGGNFLLDVGPTGKGIIPQPEVNRLLAMGRWLRVNGDAIYGSHRTPFAKRLPFGYATQKPGKLFLEVTRWPVNRTLVVPMHNKIIKAWMLTNPYIPLQTTTGYDGQLVYLPAVAPDPVATVVVLKINGPVEPLNQ